VLEFLIQHAKTYPKPFRYRLINDLVNLEDQEEALTNPEWAYRFARDVKGANIEVCQEVVINSSRLARCAASCAAKCERKFDEQKYQVLTRKAELSSSGRPVDRWYP